MAYKYAGGGSRETLSLPEFQDAYREGRILKKADLKDKEVYRGGELELVTFSGENRSELTGLYSEKKSMVKEWTDQQLVMATVQVDVLSLSNDLTQTFGDLDWVESAAPTDQQAEKITFSELKTLFHESKLGARKR